MRADDEGNRGEDLPRRFTKIEKGKVGLHIKALAEQHQVVYEQTDNDRLANVITRLSDDAVELDEVELLLIELKRAGVINKDEANCLYFDYLNETDFRAKPKNLKRG